MNGIQNGNNHNIEKPFPGCLGRMVNLFDLSTGATGNRLLTDKPHCHGSPLSRSQSDVARMSPVGNDIEDKVIVSELRRNSSNKKPNGTPMKMLIAQEMSKEVESKNNPPSLVAKLMGLDALPQKSPDLEAQRSHSGGYSRSYSGTRLGYWQQENEFMDLRKQHETRQYPEDNDYKDVYDIWQHSQKTNYRQETSPHKERYNDATNDKRMALVRQKFIEAKRLATDEKLRQSKQFQEALEVLSSNKDIFLKFLQEPNSLLSEHLCKLQSIPPQPETKRITVLRPSKMVDGNKFTGLVKKNDKQFNKSPQVSQLNRLGRNSPSFSPPVSSWKVDDNATQPTRIVVLKPSPGKLHNTKVGVSPPFSSPRILHDDEFFGVPENDEARESSEVAKEIAQKMRENLSGHRRDETLLSSVFSNGYVGDDSSFNKSEDEYAAGNLSDSEVMSPASRYSWDYINRFGSPYSSSSFSRASYSPESSVCREAKKRLSERWAMMTSNASSQEHRHVRRSSSTLGEMLALSDANKTVRSEEVGINKQQEHRGSTSCMSSESSKDEDSVTSPRNLLRSKSVPVSSTVYGTRLNVEGSDSNVCKANPILDVAKERGTKSSFKGKVSSLFFSRNKRTNIEKSGVSPPKDESKSPDLVVRSLVTIVDDKSQCFDDGRLEERVLPDLHRSLDKSTSMVNMVSKPGMISYETVLSATKPAPFGNTNENQDQPSPISVLEPTFVHDDHTTPESAGTVKADRLGLELPVRSVKSNLIDKSPPIGSVARTLSWDDSCVDTATSYPSKPSIASQVANDEEQEQEWLFFVGKLLSAAGLDEEAQSDSKLLRWHTPESPLDPSLRDKYVDLNNNETLHEGKRRQRRSTRKLVFDCVNVALADIWGFGSGQRQRLTIPSDEVQEEEEEEEGSGGSSIIMERVWARMKEWLVGEEVRCFSAAGDGGDSNSLVVEMVEVVVRKEVVGTGWINQLSLELDNLGKEIEAKLVEELVQDTVVELTGKV